ncbi:MAG: single-stranded DNA-binding protein [Bacteroidales bacterium]|nr:single-stranded DNA-binding protein [Bacteroidales bacterium]
MYLNKVMLIGRIGAKPKVHYVKEDMPKASFSLAVDEPHRSQNGELQYYTEWVDIEAWRNVAKFCEAYLDKGKLIYVEGHIRSSKWAGQDGQEHSSVTVIAESIRLLESKKQTPTSEETPQNNGNNSQNIEEDIIF